MYLNQNANLYFWGNLKVKQKKILEIFQNVKIYIESVYHKYVNITWQNYILKNNVASSTEREPLNIIKFTSIILYHKYTAEFYFIINIQ